MQFKTGRNEKSSKPSSTKSGLRLLRIPKCLKTLGFRTLILQGNGRGFTSSGEMSPQKGNIFCPLCSFVGVLKAIQLETPLSYYSSISHRKLVQNEGLVTQLAMAFSGAPSFFTSIGKELAFFFFEIISKHPV